MIIIIIIMSVVPLGTEVVYKSSPAFSVPGDKPEITPAVLPTFVQCSSSPPSGKVFGHSVTLFLSLFACTGSSSGICPVFASL
jgi:hypothetical protein